MKSEHRHELETNWLAHHAAIWLERVQPYNGLIVGGLIVAAIALFAVSYFSGESSARQAEAWNSYNQAVIGSNMNLELLRKSAGEYPDSPMQEIADITWADGQMYLASRFYIQNRKAADEAAGRAAGTYESLLAETESAAIRSRAHFGLGRIYELRNELDKARDEYGKVEGGFKMLADQRIEQLKKPEVVDVYAWLATAQGPANMSPTGPGTPGLSPGFSPGEIELPDASGEPADEKDASAAIDELFKGIGAPAPDNKLNDERYKDGESAPAGEESKPAESDTDTKAAE